MDRGGVPVLQIPKDLDYQVAFATPDSPPHEVNWDTITGQRDGYKVQRDMLREQVKRLEAELDSIRS